MLVIATSRNILSFPVLIYIALFVRDKSKRIAGCCSSNIDISRYNVEVSGKV